MRYSPAWLVGHISAVIARLSFRQHALRFQCIAQPDVGTGIAWVNRNCFFAACLRLDWLVLQRKGCA